MASSEFKQSNPWIEIWLHPREVLKEQLQRDPRRWVLTLAIINGVVSGLSWAIASWTKYAQVSPIINGLIFTLILVLGAILGVLSLYLASWIYKVTGRWLKGKGDFTAVKCAVGWSYYPYLVAGLFGILNMLTVRIPLLGLFFGLIMAVLTVWSFIISLKLLGQAHDFSAWRALAMVFITVVLIFIVIVIVMLLIPQLAPLFVK